MSAPGLSFFLPFFPTMSAVISAYIPPHKRTVVASVAAGGVYVPPHKRVAAPAAPVKIKSVSSLFKHALMDMFPVIFIQYTCAPNGAKRWGLTVRTKNLSEADAARTIDRILAQIQDPASPFRIVSDPVYPKYDTGGKHLCMIEEKVPTGAPEDHMRIRFVSDVKKHFPLVSVMHILDNGTKHFAFFLDIRVLREEGRLDKTAEIRESLLNFLHSTDAWDVLPPAPRTKEICRIAFRGLDD